MFYVKFHVNDTSSFNFFFNFMFFIWFPLIYSIHKRLVMLFYLHPLNVYAWYTGEKAFDTVKWVYNSNLLWSIIYKVHKFIINVRHEKDMYLYRLSFSHVLLQIPFFQLFKKKQSCHKLCNFKYSSIIS